MARYRYGNNYRLAFGDEVEFGSGATHSSGATPATLSTRWDELTVVPDKIEFFLEDSIIQTGNKTQTGLGSLCETDIGHQHRRVVMTGNLSHEHFPFLLDAYGLDDSEEAGRIWLLNGIPANLPSFVIMRIWDDAVTETNKYMVDIAKGCQLTELKITGASGDLVKYEATFMASTFQTEQRFAITKDAGEDPGTVCTEGFSFGNVSAEVKFGHPAHIKSFSLTLGSELADDATSYQNSNTRLAVIPTFMTGELNITNNYDPDSVEDKKIISDYLNKRIGHKNIGLTLENSELLVTFMMNIQITNYTFADPDKQLFENNITGRLVNTSEAPPLSVWLVTT